VDIGAGAQMQGIVMNCEKLPCESAFVLNKVRAPFQLRIS